MATIVQKFGGATLDTTAKIAQVASRIRQHKRSGENLVVVVSAMGKSTDSLLEIAHELSVEPPLPDMDTLLNTGEMVSMALLSIALNAKGCSAIGLCGYQAGIQTDRFFSNASITEIDTGRILEAFAKNQIVVVAGFQGQTQCGELTTLGRGGSDTTAVGLAASLGAERCEILKDVPAIFSADPRVIADAHPLRA
jgi:aspartate kinase